MVVVAAPSPLKGIEREYPNIYDYTRLVHAWALRSFTERDIDSFQGDRLRQMWRLLARTVGGDPVLRTIEAQGGFDPTYCPNPIVHRMVSAVRSGSSDAFIATTVRNIMPELINGYFSKRLKQAWYYLVDKDFPAPYVFGAPLNISDPQLRALHATNILRP